MDDSIEEFLNRVVNDGEYRSRLQDPDRAVDALKEVGITIERSALPDRIDLPDPADVFKEWLLELLRQKCGLIDQIYLLLTKKAE
jgi:hypothetical protein